MNRFRHRFSSAVAAGALLAATLPAPVLADGDPARGDGLDLRIRLAVDPVDPPMGYDPCGTATTLVAYTGERIRWCYRVTNNSNATVTRHDLETVLFGTLLTNFPYSIAPGGSAFLTRVADATSTQTEEAVWTAYNPGPTNLLTATAAGRVTVRPGISVVATVGVDPIGPPPSDYCATDQVVNVAPGRRLRWCFRVTNHSSIARTRHTLRTNLSGDVITDFPYTLETDANAFITVTQTMGETNLRQTGTWTAFRPGPGYVSSATASARAIVNFAVFADGFE